MIKAIMPLPSIYFEFVEFVGVAHTSNSGKISNSLHIPTYRPIGVPHSSVNDFPNVIKIPHQHIVI